MVATAGASGDVEGLPTGAYGLPAAGVGLAATDGIGTGAGVDFTTGAGTGLSTGFAVVQVGQGVQGWHPGHGGHGGQVVQVGHGFVVTTGTSALGIGAGVVTGFVEAWTTLVDGGGRGGTAAGVGFGGSGAGAADAVGVNLGDVPGGSGVPLGGVPSLPQ